MVDNIVVQFEDLTSSKIQSVTNWTSYNLVRDFFRSADGFTLTCEDDRVDQLLNDIQVGQRLQFIVNNCCILVGYIDTVELEYTRGGKGKSLVINGRDICGVLEDAHLFPNLGVPPTTNTITTTSSINTTQSAIFSNGGTSSGPTITNNGSPSNIARFTNTQILNGLSVGTGQAIVNNANGTQTTTTTNVLNYQFNAQTTLREAMQMIFINNLTTITNIIIDDGVGDLTLSQAVGVTVGARKAKTGRGTKKAFQNQIKRLCKPEKSETYLRYASRIMKHAGCFIKCLPGTDNTLVISPPTYDRSGAVPFTINHTLLNNQSNNAHNGKMRVSYKEQPSVIIGEMTAGDPTFRKQTFKVVCINELTGYIQGSTQLNINTAIPNVGQAIGLLTTGVPGTGQTTSKTTYATTQTTYKIGESGPGNLNNTTYLPANSPTINGIGPGSQVTTVVVPTTVSIPPSGYYLIPPNADLYNALNRTPVNVTTNFSRPLYFEDYNAQTPEELMIGVEELMASFQDKFFELTYRLDNHSQNGVVWAPNLMCNITDDAFAPSNTSVANTYWIQKVNFTKSRGGGTEVLVQFNLPYIHMVNFTEN